MDRSKGRNRHYDDQLYKATPATKSMPPFRPTCRYNRGALPPLGDYGKFLEEHMRLYDGARKTHEAVVASTLEAATKRHRGCLEDHNRASWLGSRCVSNTGFETAVRKTLSGRIVAVLRRRRVATTNTRRVCNGSVVKPWEGDALLLSEAITMSSELQEFIPGDVTITEENLQMRSAATSTSDVNIENVSLKTKTLRRQVQEQEPGAAGPKRFAKMMHGSKGRDRHYDDQLDKATPATKSMLPFRPTCCYNRDAIQEDSVQVPTSPVAPLPEVPALNNDRVQASSSTQSYSRTNNPTRENAASMYKVIPAQSADVGGPAILQISSSRSSPEVRLFTDPCASSESDSSSRHCERLDKKGESGGLTLCRYSSDSHLPRCVRTPTELSSCSQESDDSDALLSELESELEGAEGSDSSKHAWGLQNGSQAGTPRCKRCALNYDLMEKLEQTNFELQQQLRYVSEKTSAREAESMRMLAEARAELLSKNDKLAKLLEMVTKEKDTMVVKYATSEKEVILARRALEDMEKKYREVVKERDQHFSRVRSLNNERARLCSSLDTKLADMAKLQKEQERLKEELSARDIKIKWAQNKLKTEVDAHKETQAKLEQAQLRLRDLREEAEQVRRDCQEMIRRYQESEEIKSVSLDHQLKEKLSELEEQKMEKESQEEASLTMSSPSPCNTLAAW
ncbi:hypothetical protein HPB52_015128 [Rhipicephalus sanguineus]|uniref:Uncharacterized protein n=1 Tax=Rhipicephalus sanguineus TaxID=34632 RepID=A0A9D4TAP6_RHISA|nr:hypothetical protein HPB52_015128 [Rhipicephalus sanguineus]